MKKRDIKFLNILAIAVSVILTIGLVMMVRNKQPKDSTKVEEETAPVYFMNYEIGEIQETGNYTNTNGLVEITLETNVTDYAGDLITIYTPHESFMGAVVNNKIVYIGQSPDESNPITGVYVEKENKSEINKEAFKLNGGEYLLVITEEDVNTAYLSADTGGYIPTEIRDGKQTMIVNKELFEKANSFELTIKKQIPIKIN